MPDFLLRNSLRELCDSPCTLLWLEGATHERVISVKLSKTKLVLQLANETCRVVAFDRYAVTSVGLQFWARGRPGVLYRWEQVPRTSWQNPLLPHDPTDDDTPPPGLAA